MNDAESFDLSTAVERRLDELNDIFKAMRWLEFTHELTPHERDLPDYEMLIDDLAAGAHRLTQELTTASRTDNTPAALAASDFPTAIQDALTISPATPTETRGNTTSRPSNHITR
jgi:hypothetical protein